jgi:hypothetical protein
MVSVGAADGSTGLPINRAGTVTFSKEMAPATLTSASPSTAAGTTYTVCSTATQGGACVTPVAGVVTYAGNTATFKPDANLVVSTWYKSTISSRATDLAGNPLVVPPAAGGLPNPWSWQTGLVSDTIPPRMIAVGATDGTTGLPVNRASTVTFSEAMDQSTLISASPSTAAGTTFTVCSTATQGSACVTPVAGVVTYVGTTATFKPNANLAANTWYKSTITSSAKDLAGNALVVPPAVGGLANPWSWQTGAGADTTPPLISLESPDNLGTAVAVNSGVNATFNEAMDPTSITFTLQASGPPLGTELAGAVTYDSLTNIATFKPVASLAANTKFTATVTGKDLAGNSLIVPGVVSIVAPINKPNPWTFTTAASAVPSLVINMGTASTFGIAATAGITDTNTVPLTTISGDVVLSPTLTCNAVAVPGGVGSAGFGLCGSTVPTSVPVLNGTVYITGDVPTAGVIADLKAAFLQISPPAGPPAAGSLAGATDLPAGTTLGAATGSALVLNDNLFHAGVFQSLTSILITGDLTLDAQGDPNAVFVFQSSSTVGTADGAAPPGTHTRILLVNGAKASNVWWQAGTSATLGLYSEFQGNILASESITMKTGATSCGRLLAGAFAAGAFVFDSNVVSVPGQVFAPPAGYSSICQ